MASKWFGAWIILAIAALILGWIFGMPKIDSMQNDIRAALDSKGYQNIQVDMSGNVATLTGEAASEAARADAVSVAENTQCSKCKNKRTWHEVEDKMSAQSLPVQSPYTFNAVKDASGSVTVSGFVPSETEKSDILLAANRIFNTKVIDRKIKVAAGAPDAKFTNVTESYMNQLALLDKGSFSQEDYNGLLKGTASDAGVRDSINAAGQAFGGKYGSGFRANISVPAAPVKEIKSVTDCQALFEDVKGDNRILFETNAANIKGAESFDLLNKIAAAANRCSSFSISIGGHTDSIGDEAYNQRLSEARAATVKNYLSQQQVEANRMTATGFGETSPQATNATAEGRAQNRRITFTVTQGQ
jgi:OOP family OmpA-OmpF porin